MDNLIYFVSKLRNQMENYLLDELAKRGITDIAMSHGNVLFNLKDNTKMNYRELSKKVNKSPQTMTTLVRKLEKEHYITITIDASDKRNKIVSLTDKGQEFIPIMFEISKNMYNIQYQGFTEEEENILKRLLERTTTNFEVK